MISSVPGSRILLVDDEVAVRNLYQILLEKHGMIVSTVSGVQEALWAINTKSFDVAVVDLQLLDGDGMEVVRHIRKTGSTQAVVMSGYSYHMEIMQELTTASIGFYDKNLPLLDLVKLIEKAINCRNLPPFRDATNSAKVAREEPPRTDKGEASAP